MNPPRRATPATVILVDAPAPAPTNRIRAALKGGS
jgi:hypothetical protein